MSLRSGAEESRSASVADSLSRFFPRAQNAWVQPCDLLGGVRYHDSSLSEQQGDGVLAGINLSPPPHKHAPQRVPVIAPISGRYATPFHFVLGLEQGPVLQGGTAEGQHPRHNSNPDEVAIYYTIQDLNSEEVIMMMAEARPGARVPLPEGRYKVRAQCGSGYTVGRAVDAVYSIRAPAQLSSEEMMSLRYGTYVVQARDNEDGSDGSLDAPMARFATTRDEANPQKPQRSWDPKSETQRSTFDGSPLSHHQQQENLRRSPPSPPMFHSTAGGERLRASADEAEFRKDASVAEFHVGDRETAAQPSTSALFRPTTDAVSVQRGYSSAAAPTPRQSPSHSPHREVSTISFLDPPLVVDSGVPFELTLVLPPKNRWFYLFGAGIATRAERQRLLDVVVQKDIAVRSARSSGSTETHRCSVEVVQGRVRHRRRPLRGDAVAGIRFPFVCGVEIGSAMSMRCSGTALRDPLAGGGIAVSSTRFGPPAEAEQSGVSFSVEGFFSGVVAFRNFAEASWESSHRRIGDRHPTDAQSTAQVVAELEAALSGKSLPFLQFEMAEVALLPSLQESPSPRSRRRSKLECLCRVCNNLGPLVSAEIVEVSRGDTFSMYFDVPVAVGGRDGPDGEDFATSVDLVFSHKGDVFFRYPIARAIAATGGLRGLVLVTRMVTDEFHHSLEVGGERGVRSISGLTLLGHADEAVVMVDEQVIVASEHSHSPQHPGGSSRDGAHWLATAAPVSGSKGSNAIIRCSIVGATLASPAIAVQIREVPSHW